MNFGPKVIFRQLFDAQSCTFSYLLADADSTEAILIDPVLEHVDSYLSLIRDLQLNLIYAADTHTHADHITGSGRLRDATGCMTLLGQESDSQCVGRKLVDQDSIGVGSLTIRALHTPGHTKDSYCFALLEPHQTTLFTGDTLLIRGTGRTDFQGGNASQQYHSLFHTLMKFDDHTWVYPGHDYKGWQVSTLGEEKRCNPRLQVTNEQDYCQIMDNLKLPNPKLMDIAVAANQACGTSVRP